MDTQQTMWKCVRCNHSWNTRNYLPKEDRPKKCPNCYNKNWWEESPRKNTYHNQKLIEIKIAIDKALSIKDSMPTMLRGIFHDFSEMLSKKTLRKSKYFKEQNNTNDY